jgi:hypothetical protein
MSKVNIPIQIEGFLKVYDPNNGEVFYDGHNAIHYENISVAIADALSSRGYGSILKMAFGNGGASVDETGVITYLPTNTTGQNAALYNQTYTKIVDDTSVLNSDPTRNKMLVSHTAGKVYTDIIVQALLDYGEPAGQAAFDNSTQMQSTFVFDEIGLLADYGSDEFGNELSKLLTHVIFHPIQKSLNRQIQIDYTVRIQSLTNLLTV